MCEGKWRFLWPEDIKFIHCTLHIHLEFISKVIKIAQWSIRMTLPWILKGRHNFQNFLRNNSIILKVCTEPSIKHKKNHPLIMKKKFWMWRMKILISKIEFIKWNKLKISPPANKLYGKKIHSKNSFIPCKCYCGCWWWESCVSVKQQKWN